MNIKFLDLSFQINMIRKELDESFSSFVNSNSFILGKSLSKFESSWADYCGSKYCVGVGNGLDALMLSLRALGVGTGDEVIVPTNTYIATWLAITHCQAKLFQLSLI